MQSLLPKELPSYSSKKTTTTVTGAPVNKGRSATVNRGRTTVVFDSSKLSSTTAGVTSAGTTTNTAATRQHVTVRQMEHLYDSHMIVSQGIKLKWIRNRMMM